jgi:hypothetical protein
VLTEWDEFASIDWPAAACILMPGAVVFDGRHIVDREAVVSAGLSVRTIGRSEQL